MLPAPHVGECVHRRRDIECVQWTLALLDCDRIAQQGLDLIPAEKTWDYTCHGSRFDCFGTVMDWQSMVDLPVVEE
ncbi:MAG: hypothetical protein ABIZ91_04485 [Gemmatimonadaceae bacterium]